MEMKREMKRGYTWSYTDTLTMVAIMVFGLYWLMADGSAQPSAAVAHIHRGASVLETVPLDTDGRVDLAPHGISMVVEVRQGRIRVRSSNCQERICIHKGWVHQVHDPIICLPNKVTIEVPGSDARYDAISR